MKKTIPNFKSDAEAEAFVEAADLSEFDLSRVRLVLFEMLTKAGLTATGDELEAENETNRGKVSYIY